jgi:hypothetical protein
MIGSSARKGNQLSGGMHRIWLAATSGIASFYESDINLKRAASGAGAD